MGRRRRAASPGNVKVLRIIARLNVGGPARHVSLLNAGLDARGHETVLVHGRLDTGEASLERYADERRVRLVRVDSLGRSVRPGDDLRAFAELVRVIRREQPDVVHTHTAKAGTLGRLAALAFNAMRPRRRRALVLHTFHGHVFEGYFSPAVSAAIRSTERTLAQLTDTVVTISPRQRADIVERFAIASAAKTVVVPLGLDLDALLTLPQGGPDLRASIGASPDDVIVGYAGRMVPVKDLRTLIRAFAEARVAVPRLRLMLAGDGPERPGVEALVAELGLGDRVHFIGWTDDLGRFYATLDMFVLSSLNEGTPVAGIEAMAAARAVVATSVGGVPDVVEHERSGLLVPPRDPPALADAIVRLARDPQLRQAMGAAGRERAREQYSHTRLVDDIERIYVTGLERKRRM
jgi:glycosyltransferase involved in cell wall biosynthesis